MSDHPGMKRRVERERQERKDRFQQQIADGSLSVRQATQADVDDLERARARRLVPSIVPAAVVDRADQDDGLEPDDEVAA